MNIVSPFESLHPSLFKNPLICMWGALYLHQLLIGWTNQGRWDGRVMQLAWERCIQNSGVRTWIEKNTWEE